MRSKFGLKSLLVSALALGVMVIASAAQAHEPERWMVGGDITVPTLFTTVVTYEERAAKEGLPAGKWSILLSEANEIKLAIACKTVEAFDVELEAKGKGKGKLAISKCVTYTREKGKANYSLSEACNPEGQPIIANGTLQIVESGGMPYIKAEGLGASKSFTSIFFECGALPEEVEVTGAVLIKDCLGDIDKELLTHLIEENPGESSLKFGIHTMNIAGSEIIEVYKGGLMKEFSILPLKP